LTFPDFKTIMLIYKIFNFKRGRHMKISYNESNAMKCSTLEKDLILCEKTGFDFIEIRLDMLRNYLQKYKVKDLKSFFDNNRIKPYAFNALLHINFNDDAAWKEIMDDFVFACKTGEKIGCQYTVAVTTTTKTPNTYSKSKIFEDSIKSLTELSGIGRDYGMKLAFEPVGKPWSCVRTVRQAWDIVKTINRDDIGLTFDAFNLYLYNKLNNFKDMKIVDLNKIFVVHINDGDDLPLEALDHCHRCFPGEGVIDLNNFIGTLKDIGYDGMISVETYRPQYWEKDVEWVIRKGYETTKKLIESV
jgi:2-keto-myo-inositol isomerase